MAGENCVLSATGFGTLRVKAVEISYGMTVISTEDEGRNRRAYYPTDVSDSSFSLTIKTKTYEEHKWIVYWLSEYGKLRARPDGQPGPMRVVIAARRFDRTGIPTAAKGNAIQHGNPGVDRAHGMEITLDFVGTRQVVSDLAVSKYLPPTRDALVAPHFYPGGTQLSGDEAGEDTLYDQRQTIADGADVMPSDVGSSIIPDYGNGTTRRT